MSTILITGASSGLGAEMARQLAARGHDLALCARRTDKLDALREEIRSADPGRRVEVRALDVTDDDQVFEVFRGFQADFRTIDRIVVNAGLGKGAPLGTGGHAANRETAVTNFLGALVQCDAAMEIFRAQERGHLVMVSSMSAMRGLPKTMTTYAATKAGVAHLAEGLRNELYGTELGKTVKITVLYPGYIASEMNEHVRGPDADDGLDREGREGDGRRRSRRRSPTPASRRSPGRSLAPVMKHAPLPVLKRLL